MLLVAAYWRTNLTLRQLAAARGLLLPGEGVRQVEYQSRGAHRFRPPLLCSEPGGWEALGGGGRPGGEVRWPRVVVDRERATDGSGRRAAGAGAGPGGETQRRRSPIVSSVVCPAGVSWWSGAGWFCCTSMTVTTKLAQVDSLMPRAFSSASRTTGRATNSVR